MLDVVRGSAESLLASINGILDFAALEAGRIRLDRTAFPLRSCVESVASLIRPQATSKGLRFELLIADDVPGRIVGDPLRLHQVLLTLLGNAVKFTQAGVVRLELTVTGSSPDAKAMMFRVSDTGIGIDTKTLGRLFTPFTQAESGSSRRYEGAGIGLATVRRLVQLMQGSIGAQSELGRGSTFWFLLPLECSAIVPEQQETASKSSPQPGLEQRGRVLVVDDNPVNQIVAQRALERLGYGTEIASGGEQALAKLQAAILQHSRFEAILLDCQMPGMDGYETSLAIRRREQEGRRLPIIALTAGHSDEDRKKCLESGMDDYLGKPLQLAALAEAMERWVPILGDRTSAVRASPAPAGPRLPGQSSGRSPTRLPVRSLPS
jgi:CheY-like chemotaxis protein